MSRLAVFDCDGTLVDSAAAIVAAMSAAFDAEALTPPEPTAVRRVVGLSLVEAMATLLPHADGELHEALARRYKAAFAALRAQGGVAEPLFPDVVDTLAELEARGWLLGIATGKSDRGLRHCLDAHGLHARFVTLQTADRHPSKPHPAMLHEAAREAGADHVAMIGDTSFDMAMAVAAGADAIGVAWGYHPPAELSRAGARIIAHRFADLPRHLEHA